FYKELKQKAGKIAEDYGIDFSIKEAGEGWLKYLPYACTAEEIALDNLKAGVSPEKSGEKNNPYREWIGAYIRSDPWGYLAPGYPEKAAEMAYKDAYISHRRQGIYGEMFFSAVIAAALIVEDPVEAVEIGLTEIPAESALAEAISWSLEKAPQIENYQEARDAVDKKFKGMHRVHTINNACLTVFGLTTGKKDFTRVIGETVAMGMDNDCTAATAGSITGALLGKENIPEHWYRNFNNKVYTYLKGAEELKINELVDRFYSLGLTVV
ncbi:MAG: ADP-ribosylglycohydrolase family protein, partial [bacterium]